ncbi:putative 26S proteasome non-ATPase regulatory subunit 12 [Gregarina niphandrodes]|uniref:26S proteasome non-ATPase regulatory subunit 12 n=1 Tax=Gregarina niphandrodes TaxID=110365 RepID=A0A023BD75_GRENI|nr:putative 26S proteasome non-ATPase regulatory subunit 12 [Gregarina niphandrodes]EZG86541.1 putative 26S proteasome non-ATPase regulatory subunit 12 [Gregarina niphandrodes]|eukprot:XP_011128751.1 putative 26S proteasome non-ATPase regulatory subunit 12 [Gregarina niphandrodes]
MDPGAAAFKDPVAQKDLAEVAQSAIDTAETYLNADQLADAVNAIIVAEKECRNNADGASGARLCVWLLKKLFEGGKVDDACEWVMTASKKRSQLKRVQIDLVREGMEWIGRMPDRATKYKLLDTLCKITEGKLFVEVERARTILQLAHVKEEEGDIAAAAAVIQEVQVEGNIYMDKFEKGFYLLEQMRLVIAKGDWARCQIVAKKVNKRTIEGEGFELIKLMFYGYMAQYYNHEKDMTNLAECYASCLNSKLDAESVDLKKLEAFLPAEIDIQFGEGKKLELWYLSSLLIALAVSEESPEKVSSIRVVLKKHEKALRKLTHIRELGEQLTQDDVSPWQPGCIQTVLQHPLLNSDQLLPDVEDRRKALELAYLHHNLVVVSKFYKRTSLQGLSKLLCFNQEETEDNLCTLILKGNIQAKINRPAGIVVFNQTREEDAVNNWAAAISRTLDGLCEACNLIDKECQKTPLST